MRFHINRKLRTVTEPEHRSLYKWALAEIGEAGRQVGRDQIPWAWSLFFLAIECEVVDNIEVRASQEAENTIGQTIRAKLHPVGFRKDEGISDAPCLSMFGTDRSIRDFRLLIRPLVNSQEQERCTTWGTVSYTSEVDFVDHTEDDCLIFNLFIRKHAFDQYVEKISLGRVREIYFNVNSVDGFYSEWSPSISTRNIKVLTRGEEHDIPLPQDFRFAIPRLGEVGEATLRIHTQSDLEGTRPHRSSDPRLKVEIVAPSETRSEGDARSAPSLFDRQPASRRYVESVEAQAGTPIDQQLRSIAKSVRSAAWCGVVLLLLILLRDAFGF